MAIEKVRTAREEELMIEVDRLKAWITKIKNEAWKETKHEVIEQLAEAAIVHSHCVTHPDFDSTEDWARLGVWPPLKIEGQNDGERF